MTLIKNKNKNYAGKNVNFSKQVLIQFHQMKTELKGVKLFSHLKINQKMKVNKSIKKNIQKLAKF